MGTDWVLGTVTLPAGRRVKALRHPETQQVFRDRGLFVSYPGTRPVSAKTAATFELPKRADETDDEGCDCGANGGEGCCCCTDDCPDDCTADHRGEQ